MDGVDPRHSTVVCIRCRGRRPSGEQPGTQLISRLHAQFDEYLATAFHLGEVTCMAGCVRLLAVAFSAPGKASYLFGDIDPDRDASHLIAFARLYNSLPDGWCNEGQRPPGLAGKVLARIPAVYSVGATR
jgi:predicted metal-binding protein